MQEQFYLDFASIQPGDIVLLTDSEKGSEAIRLATRADYSHAAICVMSNTLVEAQLEGIRGRSIDKICARSETALCVLRLRDVYDPDLSIRAGAAIFAKRYLAKKYDRFGALLSLFHKLPWAEQSNKVFCSQLVARAYSHAGLPLFSRKPEKIVPGDFAKLAGSNRSPLKNITATVLVKRASLWADSVGKPEIDWVILQLEIFDCILADRKVKRLARRRFGQIPGSFYELLWKLEDAPDAVLDRRIADLLEANHYPDIVDCIANEMGDPDIDETVNKIKLDALHGATSINDLAQYIAVKTDQFCGFVANADEKLIEYNTALSAVPASRTFEVMRQVTTRHRQLVIKDIERHKRVLGKLLPPP